MKIGIDASRANRNFKTGTEWYSYYLIKNLIEIDKENKYVLYSDKALSDYFLKDLNLDENKHVKVKVLRWPFKFFWTLGRLSLEMIFSSPDILFVPAHVIPFFSPKKTITTVHDIAFKRDECLYSGDVVSFDSSSTKGIMRFFIKIFTKGRCRLRSLDYLNWSTKFALKRARRVITVSNVTRNEIFNFYKVKNEKIAMVYNGYNDSLYRKIEDDEKIKEVLSSYGIKQSFFLYAGRIEKKKNINVLLEAFHAFKEKNKDSEIKLVLIGNIGFGYDEFKYTISELDLFNDVIMLGWVEEEDMPYIFNGAEIFIFPSLHEGFGIPLLQSMACGVPVIASDIEVFKEIGAKSVLFFKKLDSNDLLSKMEFLLNSPAEREVLITKGLNQVKNFSWKKCAEETLEEIKKL